MSRTGRPVTSGGRGSCMPSLRHERGLSYEPRTDGPSSTRRWPTRGPPRRVVPSAKTSAQRFTPAKRLLWLEFDWSPPAKLRRLALTSAALPWPAALACRAPPRPPPVFTPAKRLLWLEFDWSPPAKLRRLALTSAALPWPAALACRAPPRPPLVFTPAKRLLWLAFDWSPPAKLRGLALTSAALGWAAALAWRASPPP